MMYMLKYNFVWSESFYVLQELRIRWGGGRCDVLKVKNTMRNVLLVQYMENLVISWERIPKSLVMSWNRMNRLLILQEHPTACLFTRTLRKTHRPHPLTMSIAIYLIFCTTHYKSRLYLKGIWRSYIFSCNVPIKLRTVIFHNIS